MHSIVLLTKDTYTIIQEKHFSKSQTQFQNQQYQQNNVSNNILLTNPNFKENSTINLSSVLELIKEVDGLGSSEFFILKIENKSIIYRKSKESKLSIILITSSDSYKSSELESSSRQMLQILEKKYFSSETVKKQMIIDINLKELLFSIIEDLTVSFLEYLKSNKLYVRFVYFNYNPLYFNSISLKKVKSDSASVILYNQKSEKNEFDRIIDNKEQTILQKSTIKEKDLCIELDKKSFPPLDKRKYIKKFSDLKPETFKKKTMLKYFSSHSTLERYFYEKSNMIHYLFNNIFVENSHNKSQNLSIKENISFPVNDTNETVLFSLIDTFEKAQNMFLVNSKTGSEYADLVNYIEFNVVKPDVMLTRNKIVIMRRNFLFLGLQLEIYDDKSYWFNICNNCSFLSNMDDLFSQLFSVYHN